MLSYLLRSKVKNLKHSKIKTDIVGHIKFDLKNAFVSTKLIMIKNYAN